MNTYTKLAVSVVALLHIAFLALEMFFWDHEIGRSVFDMTADQSAQTAVLAANQGLYNGFLAAGLLWGLITNKRDIIFFILICVIVAGIFGALTASPSILYIQALPAAISFILMLVTRKASA